MQGICRVHIGTELVERGTEFEYSWPREERSSSTVG